MLLAGANKVVDERPHHWVGCPVGRLQHTDVKIRGQERDRLGVIVPQLIDDERLVSSLVVGSEGNGCANALP